MQQLWFKRNEQGKVGAQQQQILKKESSKNTQAHTSALTKQQELNKQNYVKFTGNANKDFYTNVSANINQLETQGKAQPAFTGVSEKFANTALKQLSKLSGGESPTLSILACTGGVLAFRPLLTLMDKSTSKEERKYNAAWITAISIINGSILLGTLKSLKGLNAGVATALTKNIKANGQESAKVKAGLNKLSEFVMVEGLMNLCSVGITRYLDRFVGNCKTSDSDESKLTPEKKAAEHKKNMFFGTVAAGVLALAALPLLPHRAKISRSISAGFSKFAKDNRFITAISNSSIIKGIGKKVGAFPYWSSVSVLTNAIMRPLMLIPKKQYYAATYNFAAEFVTFGLLKMISEPFSAKYGSRISRGAVNKLAQMAGSKANSHDLAKAQKGFGTVFSLFNNAFITVGLLTAVANNYVTRGLRCVTKHFIKDKKVHEKIDKEHQQERTRPTFVIPATTLNSGDGKPSVDTSCWLKSFKKQNGK